MYTYFLLYSEVLKPVVLPFIRNHATPDRIVFQQDGARAHNGQAHHMFSRFLNLQIYKKKSQNVLCISIEIKNDRKRPSKKGNIKGDQQFEIFKALKMGASYSF